MNWNIGGWFGGQLGGTVWIIVAGLLTAVRDFPTGMFVVLLFAIPNAVGTVLWLSRKLSCYASTQLLIGVSGICGLVTVYILENANAWMQMQTGGQVSAQSSYWIIGLVYGGLMLMLHLRFGRSGNKSEA
ncbi:MAG: hypothetical protein OES20_11115 [Gammaproteobacteria bacterium]|nr:hypothetical protein [Gammaproteobacteria bacterium]MDH3857159.1 hypothetical protein [Gammaproteobacteria bacterium]